MTLLTVLSRLRTNNPKGLGATLTFLRTNIPERIALLSENCAGFTRLIDTKTDAYANFMRVVNKRNFALHGNVDPIAERIETIYFEGRRPLFVNPGNNVQTFLEQLQLARASGSGDRV